MKTILSTILICIAFTGFAGEIKFPVSEIPDSLLKNANSVMRINESQIVVKSLSSVVNKVHFAITILNENGDNYGSLIAHYDKLQKVSDIEGALYDATGKQVKKLKSKDIMDLSATSEANLDDDNRIKAHHFYYNSYPYTVEYSYEVNIKHTFYFPPWIPQDREQLSVQKSSYELNIPKDFGIRFKTFNINAPIKKEEDGRLIYQWQLTNSTSFKETMPYAYWRDYLVAVFAAANDFELDNKKGNMETWKNFGLFQYQLIEGRDQLPDAVKEKVKQIVAGSTNKSETITALYHYLQQNTRYISIQLGIGGWQPFDAAYVAKNGFGDCKALTNYMHSLLKEAGINSYYALVNGGDNSFYRNRVIDDFPSIQFNHVILCIPSQNDTTWLECTSQTLPAGYVSGFTSNRKALLIKEDGGYLVSTPRYGINENRQLRNIKTVLQENGDATIHVASSYNGMENDALFSLVKNVSKDKVKKILSSAISIPSYELNDFKYETLPAPLPELKETLDITATNLATITGKRLFIVPNMLSRSGSIPDFGEDRKIDFNFENSYHDSSHSVITLPQGYTIEASIKPVTITTDFGKYTMTCTVKDNEIIYDRSFSQYQSKIPVDRQEEITEFFNKVYKSDRAKLVLVRKE